MYSKVCSIPSRFLNEIRKVGDQELALNRSTQPPAKPPHQFPLLLPAPHCQSREQGVEELTRSRATKIIRNNDQDQPPSAVVPYSGLPVGSYDNITAPLPNVLDSTRRRAVGTVPSPNNRLPLPSRTG
jgi:hypothetical protein